MDSRVKPANDGKDASANDGNGIFIQPRPMNRADGRDAPGAIAAPELELHAIWQRFERAPSTAKERAERAARAVMRAGQLRNAGMGKVEARTVAAAECGVSRSALEAWAARVRGHHVSDYQAVLLPAWRPGGREAEIDARLEELFEHEYLRQSQPAATVAFEHALRRRLKDIADPAIPEIEIARISAVISRGDAPELPAPFDAIFARLAPLPTASLLLSRLRRRRRPMEIRFAREGLQALKRSYPAQTRTRDHFHAGQALNADGHKIDVRVLWPDWWPEPERIARPMLLVVQDLYSGRILACRVTQTENQDTVRLAFGDAFMQWGFPEKIYLDNGRAFQAKWLTGGMRFRFRFRAQPCDPVGIFTSMLGDDAMHPTTPHWGQAKPIERAFGDWCGYIARHAAFEGAYVGSNPTVKPANAGTRVVPLEKFLEVLRIEIAAHNARGGRRAAACRGRSFDETFLDSYDRSRMRFPTDEQRRALLLTAEGVRVNRLDGAIRLLGHRYWHGALADLIGERVIARFDPNLPSASAYIYRYDGAFICEARALDPVRFDDVEAAGPHARNRAEWMRSHRVAVDANRKFIDAGPATVAAPKRVKLPAPAPHKPVKADDSKLELMERVARNAAIMAERRDREAI